MLTPESHSDPNQLGSIFGRGLYMAHCTVPLSTDIAICAAIREGRVTGVTVRTIPNDPQMTECIAAAVLELTFEPNPELVVTRTRFPAFNE